MSLIVFRIFLCGRDRDLESSSNSLDKIYLIASIRNDSDVEQRSQRDNRTMLFSRFFLLIDSPHKYFASWIEPVESVVDMLFLNLSVVAINFVLHAIQNHRFI